MLAHRESRRVLRRRPGARRRIARDRGRRHRRHRRRQRRRQDHAHSRARRNAAQARGRITFRGTDISGWPSHRVCNLGIGQVAEGRQVFPTLTVEENLDIGAMLPRARAARAKNRDRAFALFPRLAERARQPAGTLSGGEQQMLAIARCLMGAPQLIMFDEPSLGLAPAIARSVLDTIGDLNRDRHDLVVGRAECGAVAQACEPRLCFGKRPRHADRHRRRTAGRRPRAQRLSWIVKADQCAGRRSRSISADKAATRALNGAIGKAWRRRL